MSQTDLNVTGMICNLKSAHFSVNILKTLGLDMTRISGEVKTEIRDADVNTVEYTTVRNIFVSILHSTTLDMGIQKAGLNIRLLK